MAYIIDGHNLIGALTGVLPGIELGQPDDEARLIDLLLSHRAQGAGEMIVFFDSSPLGWTAGASGPQRAAARPGMEIHYATPGSSADDAIVEYVRGRNEPGQYAVVTNDQELSARVRALGASVLPSTEFAAQMMRRSRTRRARTHTAEAPAPNPRDPAYADLYAEFLAAEKLRQESANATPVSITTWIERLYFGDPQLQVRAARWLGQSRDAAAAAPLHDALTHSDAAVRAEAALALGTLRRGESAGTLCDVLAGDGNSMVREAAAQALGSIGGARAVRALEAAAQGDAKGKVRKAAEASLAAIRARRAASRP